MNSELPHIAILASRLDLPGGIERVIVDTANLFASKNHRVTVIVLDEFKGSFYSIDKSINIIYENINFGITPKGNKISRKIKFISSILTLRNILKRIQPSIIIASEYPFTIAAFFCGIKKNTKLIAWEHHHKGWLQKNRFWKYLYNYVYPRIQIIVCPAQNELQFYNGFSNVISIPYFISPKDRSLRNNQEKIILTVGWLIPRKGYDLLLPIAKNILEQNNDWKWKIIGDGEMKKIMSEFINKENLEGRLIIQKPHTCDLETEYTNASLFVLTSRFEAFPMVLLEALSFGVPCISFDCPSGPSDIISNGIDGYLIKNENMDQMIQTIDSLIKDNGKRNQFSENAFFSMDRFSPQLIYQLWEKKVFI